MVDRYLKFVKVYFFVRGDNFFAWIDTRVCRTIFERSIFMYTSFPSFNFFFYDIRLLNGSKVVFINLCRIPFFKQNILTHCRNLRIPPTNIELVVEEEQI